MSDVWIAVPVMDVSKHGLDIKEIWIHEEFLRFCVYFYYFYIIALSSMPQREKFKFVLFIY